MNYTNNPYLNQSVNYNNPYNNPYMNPYINQNMQQRSMQNQQVMQQQPVQYNQVAQIGLQGKFVDSKDTAKTAEFPYDGSISFFPLTDNSTIITKQLQQDGTTRITVYEPVVDEKKEEKEISQYVTVDEFNEKIKGLDNSKDLKEEIKNLKKQIKSLTDELEDLKEKED